MNLRYSEIVQRIDHALAGGSAAEITDRILDLRNRIQPPEVVEVVQYSTWRNRANRICYVVERITGNGRTVTIGLESLLDETEKITVSMDDLIEGFVQE